MSEQPRDARSLVPETSPPSGGIQYPTNSVLGVIDSQDRLETIVRALKHVGFTIDDMRVATGTTMADAVQSVTGRSGLAGLAVRLAERLGAADEEMEFKDHYEQAMRDGQFVLMVSAPDDERKELARGVLREQGASAVAFHGRFTIEGQVPSQQRRT